MPPPVPSQDSPDSSGTTFVNPNYPNYTQPNILMIMVDQMGTPRWLPQGGPTAIDNLLHNLRDLRNQSCVLLNFCGAATACTPDRATLLTGLYSQQTYIFNTLENSGEPELIPYTGPIPPDPTSVGFPTIGNVLSQKLPIGTTGNTSRGYDTVWIGKWHLSAIGTGPNNTCTADGSNGPTAYGFNDTQYCIPNTSPNPYHSPAQPYPSPDGSAANVGCGGGLLGGYLVSTAYQSQSPGQSLNLTHPCFPALADGAIADAFSTWLLTAPTSKPWFCAVSFVNPHDMSGFPYGFALAGTSDPNLGNFSSAPGPQVGYLPPPLAGFDPHTPPKDDTILPLSQAMLYQPGQVPVGPNGQSWNNPDDPSTPQLHYGPTNGVYGKPTLQWVYQNRQNAELGKMEDQNAWLTFLNYYFWMQANVDAQIGRVISALGPTAYKNTLIVFLSDHGDYAGSHSIHGKAWALYDESINVPLYIKFPNQTLTKTVSNACSSVDILPFLYWAALGNDSWRSNPSDLVGYLHNREAIGDFVIGSSALQRRLSSIPSLNPNTTYPQPYVLHTTDEGFLPVKYPSDGTTPVPSHAIAFRTVDVAAGVPYGGGKLGIYSFWNHILQDPDMILPTHPDPNTSQGGGPQQFEFYNYSAGQTLPANYGEMGNQVQISSGVLTGESLAYQNSFNAIVNSELYSLSMPSPGIVPTYITTAQTNALNTYVNYVNLAQGTADTTWQT